MNPAHPPRTLTAAEEMRLCMGFVVLPFVAAVVAFVGYPILAFGREFLVRRSDRIMFGTDYLSPGQAVPQFELLPRLKLPPEVEAKVFYENARRVLRLAD